jgi:tetratricopeptide (TPR) repeat protein
LSDYPGNPALPEEVKQRVLSTFRQTLELYDQGLLDDVVVGCEFILKMDPLFDPGKKLLEKAKNPAVKVDLGALAAITGAGRAPDVPDEPDPASVIAQAREAMAARDWPRAADLAAGVLRRDMMHVEAQQIAEEARERIEADPFIQQFAAKARQQLERGDPSGARATLTKARALDPDHPLIAEIEAEVGAAGPAFDPVSAFGAAAGSDAQQDEPATFDFSTSDSFVVDRAPGAGSSSGAPASDFGFTFEEDQGEGPEITIGKTSPGIPASVQEAAEASSSDTFDFSTASVDISTDDQKKIEGYLEQGDDAYAAEDYQKAIDLWSRIFLIDVTNDQASERIEKARSKKIEIDRQVDDLAGKAATAMEKKDAAKARGLYERILVIDPSNESAREQLQALGSGAPPEVASIPFAAGAPASAPARPAPHPFDDDFFLDEPAGEPREDIPERPDSFLDDDDAEIGRARRTTRPRPVAAPPPRSRAMLFAVIGLLVLLGVGFAVWQVFLSGDEPAVNTGSNALTTAQRLADAGQLDQAIATLLAVPAGHPDHEEALARVAELRALKAQSSGMIEGRPATEVFQEQLERANAAFAANDYVAAKAALEQAAAIQPLPPEARQLYDQANVHATQFENARNLFRSGDYPAAITASEAILQQNPQNANARDLISRARFNMGVQALQQERLGDAIAHFDALLEENPDDELAQRARELAVRYDGTNKDLLYRIFVKYLPTR